MDTRTQLSLNTPELASNAQVRWQVGDGLTNYEDALEKMEFEAERIAEGKASELIWLVEHPPVYTAGTSTDTNDLITPERFPVYETGRGGQYTYHGPGQRVVYVMLNLKQRKPDVRAFVGALENWIISSLNDFNVIGETRNDRVGVWVRRPDLGAHREDKIAAIGIRLRRWVSFHGFAINVEPDLEHYSGIVPCGIADHGVTSLVDLGLPVAIEDLDVALKKNFEAIFHS